MAEPRRTSRNSMPSAFTLIELLVVISIIVIGTAVVVPAFARIIRSTAFTTAINDVTATLGNARAEAIRTGRHTGVVFLYDVDEERYTLQVVDLYGQQGGALTSNPASDPEHTYCLVFKPATNQTPVELPAGTGVYALSFQVAPRQGDGADIDADTVHWYSGDRVTNARGDQHFWLFPRNDPRHFMEDQEADPWASPVDVDAVRHASSFYLLFSPEGSVVTNSTSGGQTTPNAYLEYPDAPLDRDDPGAGPVDDPFVFDPEITDEDDGFEPNPEVVLRPAQQLAVVDLRELSKSANVDKPWFVRPPSSRQPKPAALERYFDLVLAREVSNAIDLNAEIIGFNRYTGNVIRRDAQ